VNLARRRTTASSSPTPPTWCPAELADGYKCASVYPGHPAVLYPGPSSDLRARWPDERAQPGRRSRSRCPFGAAGASDPVGRK